MKRISAFFILLWIFAQFSNAQSVDLDPQKFKISYVQLPKLPIENPANRSYYVISESKKFDNNLIQKSVIIKGLTRNKTHGYLVITVNEPGIKINSSTITQIMSKKKMPSDVPTVVGYAANYNYFLDINFSVKDSLGNILKKYNSSETKTTTGKEEKEKSKVEGYISNQNDPDLTKYILSDLNDKILDKVTSDFGYDIIEGNDKLWILDSKKNPEYEDQQKAYQVISNSFSTIAYDKPTSEIKSKIQPAISYFESIEGKFPGVEKKDRKIKYGSYFNLALINYYLDDLDKATFWCNKLIANDFDGKDGERILNMIKDSKERMEINKNNTSHLAVISPDNYEKEETLEVARKEKSRLSKVNNPGYSKAKVTFKDNRIAEGYLEENWNENLGSSLRFLRIPREGKKDSLVDISTVYAVTVEFQDKTLFRAVTIVEPVLATIFARELYNEGRMKSYIVDDHYVIFQHKEQKPIVMNAVDWVINSNKLYKVLGSNCPGLSERVENKEFGKSEDKIIKFCKAWDESCK